MGQIPLLGDAVPEQRARTYQLAFSLSLFNAAQKTVYVKVPQIIFYALLRLGEVI